MYFHPINEAEENYCLLFMCVTDNSILPWFWKQIKTNRQSKYPLKTKWLRNGEDNRNREIKCSVIYTSTHKLIIHKERCNWVIYQYKWNKSYIVNKSAVCSFPYDNECVNVWNVWMCDSSKVMRSMTTI